MRIRPIAALLRQSIVSSVVLAGLTSLTLLFNAGTAAAKPMTACQVKHSFCTERCIMNAENEGKGNACLARTCDHQFRACASQSGESRDPRHDWGNLEPPRGGRPIGGRGGRGGRPSHLISQSSSGPAGEVRGPLGGGLLDNVIGIRQQGPAATGSPMAPASAPSAPPVIIR